MMIVPTLKAVRMWTFLLVPGFVCSLPGQHSELARTPPMGWNSWNEFRLKIDDATIRTQAEALVKSGMKRVGYEYVVIDGGWEGRHDEHGIFHSDEQRFPDMKGLCDY